MLYCVEENVLTIYDLIDGITYQFDLGKFNFYNKITVNCAICSSDRNIVVISFEVTKKEGPKILERYEDGILLCKMKTNEINKIYDKVCHDVIFDKTDSNRLFINSNGMIFSFCMTKGTINKIYKFRKFIEAPIDMCQSHDGRYLLFCKYKSDNRILHLINLENNTLAHTIGSTFKYDFLSNNEIIHSLSSGLQVYNIKDRKNICLLQNTARLVEKYKDSPDIHQVSQALSLEKDDRMIADEISSPYVFCERLYFKVFIASKKKRFSKWCSVNMHFDDFQIHIENPGFWGTLHIYGDSSRHIFVVYSCSERPSGRKWSCSVFDDGNLTVLEQYMPICFG